jgi:threonine/homoserine/homoserine lactone efflux protein
MSDPLVFILAVLTILGTPGPTNTLLATGGATLGVRLSLPLLAGAIAAYLIAIVTIRVALAPLIAAYPLIGMGLKIAVAHLAAPVRVTLPMVFVATLLNPKSIIFALGILPAAHEQIVWYFVAFAAAAAVTGFAWILVGRAIGAGAGKHARLVPRVASVVLAGFAGLILSTAFG